VGQCANPPCFPLVSTIAFVSTRDNPAFTPPANAAEIYLMDGDGTDPQRLTDNLYGDGFPVLSPNGRTIVFDSNRTREAGEPVKTTAMFLMDRHGNDQTHLLRGGSAAWSGDGKNLVFHRSASGTGLPACSLAGCATIDSDIFVMNVDDFLAGEQHHQQPGGSR
jgi:Tol biopolymer transport system component